MRCCCQRVSSQLQLSRGPLWHPRSTRHCAPTITRLSSVSAFQSLQISDSIDSKLWGIELGMVLIIALLTNCWQERPVGWSKFVAVTQSEIHGKGVFATQNVPSGTIVGRYPGRLRTPEEVCNKAEYAPKCKGYVFATAAGLYLDPTDVDGNVSAYPGPGMPWPLAIDPAMAYVNEPLPGGTGPNVEAQDGSTTTELVFVTTRDVFAGEELFIDYGCVYDRSDYRP